MPEQPVAIVCQHCGGASQVEAAWLGRQVSCPHCGAATVAATTPPPTPSCEPNPTSRAKPAPPEHRDSGPAPPRRPLTRGERRAIRRRRQLVLAVGGAVALVAVAAALIAWRS